MRNGKYKRELNIMCSPYCLILQLKISYMQGIYRKKKVQKEIILRVIKQFPVSHSKLGEVGRFTGVSHSNRG